MHILFLSRWFPEPPDNGSKLRVLNLLRGLAEHHRVSLLSFADEPVVEADYPTVQSICDRVVVVPWKSYHPQSWRARLGFFNRTPRSLLDTFSPEMAAQLDTVLKGEHYDLIIGSQLGSLIYAPHFHNLPALLEESELGVFHTRYSNATSLQEKARAGLTWFKYRRYIASQMQYFRGSTVVSDQERQLLKLAAPTMQDVEVIPNCVTVADYAQDHLAAHQQPKLNSLIFTGSFGYFANYEAIRWFMSEVYPLIQQGEPATSLTISGDHGNRPLPPATHVTLTGYVDSVRPLIANAWCSIAPLQSGGGTRLKILEAMALRTPVVTTTKGAEGLDAEDGKHVLIADTPTAFAQAVLRLFHESGLREKLVENSYTLVCNRYDWSVTMPRFLNVVERVARR